MPATSNEDDTQNPYTSSLKAALGYVFSIVPPHEFDSSPSLPGFKPGSDNTKLLIVARYMRALKAENED